MTRPYIYIIGIVAILFTACSSDDITVPDADRDAGKTPIALTSNLVGDVPLTRAGFKGEGATLLMLRMKSEKVADYDDANTLRVEDVRYMTTSASAAADTDNNDATHSAVTFTLANTRWWDDVHGRNAAISVWGLAVPNVSSFTATSDANKAYFTPGQSTEDANAQAWNTFESSSTEAATTGSKLVFATEPGSGEYKATWTVSQTQTTTTVKEEDLCFSNNITGSPDNRLKFNTSSHTFATGELEFHHALTKFTFNLLEVDGFTEDNDFLLSSLKLHNLPLSGTVDVATGLSTSVGGTTDNIQIEGTQSTATDDETHKKTITTSALMYPGSTISGTDDFMEIVVDDNKYKVSKDLIHSALDAAMKTKFGESSSFSTTLQGYHYTINISLSKKDIQKVSASLVDWTNVSGDMSEPSNANVTIKLQAASGTAQAFDLYRSAQETGTIDDFASLVAWQTHYNDATGGKATTAGGEGTTGIITGPDASDNYETTWKWPNNKTAYHFRSITPQGKPVVTASEDYVTLTSGAIATANDIIWGAPFKATTSDGEAFTGTYNPSTGYASDLSHAIGPTTSNIRLVQLHMMTKVNVELTTSAESSGDHVNLSGATVEFSNFSSTGTLAFGSGLVTPSDTKVPNESPVPFEYDSSENKYTQLMVPQPTANIKVTITAEGNKYKINNLATVALPASESGRWLPGKNITYKFHLTKTGIDNITATLVDWIDVDADSQTVKIE